VENIAWFAKQFAEAPGERRLCRYLLGHAEFIEITKRSFLPAILRSYSAARLPRIEIRLAVMFNARGVVMALIPVIGCYSQVL
jgi:hypothetical protein